MTRKLKENKIIVKGSVSYVYPTNYNSFFIVDTEDLDLIKQYCWSVKKDSDIHIYGRARERGTKKFVLMHRIICGNPTGKTIDHINHNTMDNRKENLLVCDKKTNNKNKIKYALKEKGINYENNTKIKNKWRAMYSNKYIGWFETKEEAIKAREMYLKENNIYVSRK